MIDIVDIRTEARKGNIIFYVKDNCIYCKDKQSGEIVNVSVEHSVNKVVCPTCKGSRFDPYDWRDPRPSICHQCNGKGYIIK